MAIEDSFYQGFLELALAAFNIFPLTNWRVIYNLYGGGGAQANFDPAVLDTFLENLLVAKNQANGVMQVEVQEFPDGDNWAHLDRAFIDNLSDAGKQEIWDTFYHFRRANTPALKRLYIHAKPPIETNGLSILRKLLQVPNAPGLVNLKIGGPGCTNRADTIVAFFSDKASLQAVIDALQKSDFHPPWFEDGIPTGTLPLSFLKKPGVAGADEVPDLGTPGIDTRTYGAFLSTLIYEAYVHIYLLWANSNPAASTALRKQKFLESLLEACDILRVDAKTIHLTQKDYKKLDEQLGLVLPAQARLHQV